MPTEALSIRKTSEKGLSEELRIGHAPIKPHLAKASGVQRRPVVPRRCIHNHGGPPVFRMAFGRHSLTCRVLVHCRQTRIAVNTVLPFVRSSPKRDVAAAGDGPMIVACPPPIRAGIRLMEAHGEVKAQIRRNRACGCKERCYTSCRSRAWCSPCRPGRHSVAVAPSICSAFELDRRADAPTGFFKGPTGCAINDTSPGGIQSAAPLETADGPFPF